ncbi:MULTISPECIES: porin [Caldimonas]|uniref:porin n=1 Tax=Caldimonas TaxID=196013 RepID=UPI0003703519|nr:porin [Caldimonas manganoxidans]
MTLHIRHIVRTCGLALLGLGWAGAALAQSSSVQLYGLLDLAIGSYQTSGGQRLGRIESGGMTTSYIGFSGKEDLGGGLAATFTLDHFLRADTGEAARFGGDTFWARNAHVGVSGGFGSVYLGRRATPMFVATLLFNPFGDSFGFSPSIRSYYGATGVLAGDSGWNDAISYASPRLLGAATVNLQYALKESGNGANVGANVLYFGGPLAAAVAAQQVKKGLTVGKETAYQLGASYTVGAAKLFAQYGRIEERTALDLDDDIYQLGLSYRVGAGSLLASWGVRQTTGDAPSKRRMASLGYDHFLSKRTDVYAVYMVDKLRATEAGHTVAVGLRHRF